MDIDTSLEVITEKLQDIAESLRGINESLANLDHEGIVTYNKTEGED